MSDPRDVFASVPLPAPECCATIVVPARNEAGRIGRTLEAIARQRDIDGSALPASLYDVLVYANNCDDATAAIVRATAERFPAHAMYVAEEMLPTNVAHIGTARRAVMQAAAARFTGAGRTDGIVCSTDADTVPGPRWLAWTLREMRRADAVTGRIVIDATELAALPETTRRMLAEEDAYHFAVARLAALLNPKTHDPWPHHWQRSGPSFAVRVGALVGAGGVPPVRTLEDIALYDALVASGARIRHSLNVRVTTSARLDARAHGGFGERIGAWSAEGSEHRLLVEDPEVTVARLCGEPVPPADRAARTTAAVAATVTINQAIARGVSAARATRSNVASIAG